MSVSEYAADQADAEQLARYAGSLPDGTDVEFSPVATWPDVVNKRLAALEGRKVAAETERDALRVRIDKALGLLAEHGQVEGKHHTDWLLNQMLWALTGGDLEYFAWLGRHVQDGHGWSAGIAP